MNIQGISHFLIQADIACDIVPGLSAVNNIIDLFQKYVILPRMKPSEIASSHYYTYLNEKTFTRCLLLLVPILGHIAVYIGDLLWNDKEYVLEQVKKKGPEVFKYASDSLRNSRSFITTIMQARQDDLILKYAGELPKNSKCVLKAATELNGLALEWAGEIPRDNKKIVRAAALQNPWAFMYASARLKDDEEFVLELMASSTKKEDLIHCASKRVRQLKNVALVRVAQDGMALQNVGKKLRGDKEVALAAVLNNPKALDYVRDELCYDEDIMFAVEGKEFNAAFI